MTRSHKDPKLRKSLDLLDIFDEINDVYFGGMVCGGLEWQNLQLGDRWDYAFVIPSTRVITVNTLLLDIRIPLWFVRYIIFHEMLHLWLGPQFDDDGNELDSHSNRFNSLESRYEGIKRCREYSDCTQVGKIVDSWIAAKKRQRQRKQKRNNRK